MKMLVLLFGIHVYGALMRVTDLDAVTTVRYPRHPTPVGRDHVIIRGDCIFSFLI